MRYEPYKVYRKVKGDWLFTSAHATLELAYKHARKYEGVVQIQDWENGITLNLS